MLKKVKDFFGYIGTVSALYWYLLTGGKIYNSPTDKEVKDFKKERDKK